MLFIPKHSNQEALMRTNKPGTGRWYLLVLSAFVALALVITLANSSRAAVPALGPFLGLAPGKPAPVPAKPQSKPGNSQPVNSFSGITPQQAKAAAQQA